MYFAQNDFSRAESLLTEGEVDPREVGTSDIDLCEIVCHNNITFNYCVNDCHVIYFTCR